MEHNFNPNKGDDKYILDEERRNETGEVPVPYVSPMQKLSNRFWNWIIIRLMKRSKRTDQLKISFPILFEFLW
jgi:hypothetical protein